MADSTRAKSRAKSRDADLKAAIVQPIEEATRSVEAATERLPGGTHSPKPKAATPARSKSNLQESRRKPLFPLWHHKATGQWGKTIRGRKYYFGTDKDAALAEYLRVKEYRESGREPPPKDATYVTLKLLVNSFLEHKDHQLQLGELTRTSFNNYERTCELLCDFFGRTCDPSKLTSGDLLRYRRQLAKTRGVHALGNEVTRVRVVFRFAFEASILATPIRFGEFKRPKKVAFRRQRQSVGSRMFLPADVRKLLDAADVQLRAMIYLAINCGFGNADVGQLPIDAIDLEAGWIDFPRPKTGIDRRCPLWPETSVSLAKWLELRREKRDEHQQLAFVTKYGWPWHRDGEPGSPLSAEFRKLLVKLKLYRRGLSFYSLRHCFQTVGDDLGDYIATRRVMGHADHSISDHYREQFPDTRLRRVVNHVREWLYPRPTVLPAEGGAE